MLVATRPKLAQCGTLFAEGAVCAQLVVREPLACREQKRQGHAIGIQKCDAIAVLVALHDRSAIHLQDKATRVLALAHMVNVGSSAGRYTLHTLANAPSI